MKKKFLKSAIIFAMSVGTFLTLAIFLVSGVLSGYVLAVNDNGGGLFVGSSSNLEISAGTSISGNSATDGGGVYIASGGTLNMKGSNVRIDADGNKDENGDYILFGSYPKTYWSDTSVITSVRDSNGYYIGTDGTSRYAKVSANPSDSSFVFNDGTTIVSGTTYYFKVEPLKWRILKIENGKVLLFCEEIIDVHIFNSSSDRTINGSTIYTNNYKYSNIRAWLNGYSQEEGNTSGENWLGTGFLQTAFTTTEQNSILTTEVDNSASTTESSSNIYACENTNDKIFLLSYQDMINTEYGFNLSASEKDMARQKQTTDYSRANYAYYSTNSSYLYNASYWLRSPLSSHKDCAIKFDFEGVLSSNMTIIPINGVVPALYASESVLYDCSISGNTATNGGGVYVISEGTYPRNKTFEMEGGIISNNSAENNGGGVYVKSDGSSFMDFFSMEDGIISNNSAENSGGGVFVVKDGTFYLGKYSVDDIIEFGSYPKISGNTATYGGGVFVAGDFTMNDGEISNNSAESGGGVNLGYSGSFTMNGGTICSNKNTSTTDSDKGYNLYTAGTFTMNGGTIGTKGSSQTGYGIYSWTGSSMHFYGGTVYDNIYSSCPAPIYLKKKANIVGSITLDKEARIILKDYSGTTPKYKIILESSWSAESIITLQGSTTAPDVSEMSISGYDTNLYNLEAIQGSSEDEWKVVLKKIYTRVDEDGNEDESGDYVLFGSYPKTYQSDESVITTTQDENGYYLGTDGTSRYAKVSANPNESSYTFNDGTTIVSVKEYYFKIEPIKWRILKTENGKALLFCEEIIDAHHFYNSTSSRTINGSTIYANNYKYSDIRAWLNGYGHESGNTNGENWLGTGFLQKAFTTEEQSFILTTEVDNSASTTGSSSNNKACENTYDKIFLLSNQDIVNIEYGFNSSNKSDITRSILTTDFALANYCEIMTNKEYDSYRHGYWWLRSPSSNYIDLAISIYPSGQVGGAGLVTYSYVGVAPALWLDLGTGETVSNVSDSGNGETKSKNIVEKTTKNNFLNFDSMIAFMSVLCVEAISVQNTSNTNELIFDDKRKRKHKNI